MISGLQAEEHIAHGEAVHRVMETHEELGLDHAGHLRGRGALADRARAADGRRRAGRRSLACIARRRRLLLSQRRFYGGKLVFDHAAGIPTEVLEAEITSGRKATTTAREGEAEEHGPTSTRRRPRCATRPQRRPRPHHRRLRQAGRPHPRPRHAAAQGLT